MIKITLPGIIRSKKNSKRVFKRGKYTKVLPSLAYEAWEKEARQAAMLQLRFRIGVPFTVPVHVKMIAYYKGNRPDLSGAMESVGDCLEGILYCDDKQIISWDGSRLFHDKINPRTEVEVSIYNEM